MKLILVKSRQQLQRLLTQPKRPRTQSKQRRSSTDLTWSSSEEEDKPKKIKTGVPSDDIDF